MTWFRLDDGFHDNAKVLEASNAAVGVWTKCMTWSAKKETDGRVPRGAALALAKGDQGALDELVRVRLLVLVDDGAAYFAPDFTKYNPTAEMVARQREAKSQAGERGARKRWDGHVPARPMPPAKAPENAGAMAPAKAPAMAPAIADGWQSDAPVPDPDPPKPPNPLPPAGEGGSPEVEAREPDPGERGGIGPWSLKPGDPDPEAFCEVLATRGGGAMHAGATPGLFVELGERLWSIFASGKWSMGDAPVAADFAAAGGLRGKRGKKPGVDWLVRNNGVNLLWLFEASREWHVAGRPPLDHRGQAQPAQKPPPAAPASAPHRTGAAAQAAAKREAAAAAYAARQTSNVLVLPTGTEGADHGGR